MQETDRTERDMALRLLEWIANHKEDWETICDVSHHIVDADKYIRIMNLLKEESFYQIMIVFICNTQSVFGLEDYFENIAIKSLIDTWEKGSGKQLYQYLMTEKLAEVRAREKKRADDPALKGKGLFVE